MSFLYKKAAIDEKIHRTIVLLKDILNLLSHFKLQYLCFNIRVLCVIFGGVFFQMKLVCIITN